MPSILSSTLFCFWWKHINKAGEIRNYALLKVLVFNFDNNNLWFIGIDLRCMCSCRFRFNFIVCCFILPLTGIWFPIISLLIFSLSTLIFPTTLTTFFLISLLITTVLIVVTSFTTALFFKIGVFFFFCCLSDYFFILLLLYDFISQIINFFRTRLTLFLSLFPIVCSVFEHVLYQ